MLTINLQGLEPGEDGVMVAEKMDEAAEVAKAELRALLETNGEGVKAVAAWWAKHYMAAGHKRLAKLLLSQAPKNPHRGA